MMQMQKHIIFNMKIKRVKIPLLQLTQDYTLQIWGAYFKQGQLKTGTDLLLIHIFAVYFRPIFSLGGIFHRFETQ